MKFIQFKDKGGNIIVVNMALVSHMMEYEAGKSTVLFFLPSETQLIVNESLVAIGSRQEWR